VAARRVARHLIGTPRWSAPRTTLCVVTESLPLFPLESVLYPGVVLPLHIFEQRYRLLVQELSELPEGTPRRFGVVAIREGREVGADGARALFDVGCTAEIDSITPVGASQFDVVTTGVHRFKIRSIDTTGAYVRGEVDFYDEPTDQEAEVLAPAAMSLFATYQEALARARDVPVVALPELPDDPTVLSYLIAAAMVLDVADKQRLLAVPDTTSRLRIEGHMLRREIGLVTALRALPAVDILRRRGRGRT
jgi:Lon protease-like protein